MAIVRLFRILFAVIEKKLAGRNNKSKISYLRKRGCKIGETTRFSGSLPHIGEPYLVEIGEDCLISGNVYFYTHDGGVKVLNSLGFFKDKMMDKMGRIKIGNNCFIGNGASILMGVSIGDNCIIGANSVVTKSIPNNSVVAGMPARVICTVEDYYEKNVIRKSFYYTQGMNSQDKQEFLQQQIPNFQ